MTRDSFQIRLFADRDFEDYAETLMRTWPCDDIEEARESVGIGVERARDSPDEEIWVAETGGRAVGFMILGFTKVWGNEGESFEETGVCVHWFDVHPEYQRRGIGQGLLNKARKRGRENRLGCIFMHTAVDNLPMVNLAAKNAFRFERLLKGFYKEGTSDAFLLVKGLDYPL